MLKLLLLTALVADPGFIQQASPLAGGTYTGDACFPDDLDVRFGACTGGDYWFTYNSTGTQFELWSTDGDGGGTDTLIWAVSDGGDDLAMTGVLTATGGASFGGQVDFEADDTKVTIGAGKDADGYFAWNSTTNELEWHAPGGAIRVLGTLYLSFPIILPTNAGAMGPLFDMPVDDTPSDGDEMSACLFASSEICVLRGSSEADGAGSIDVGGTVVGGPNGAEANCAWHPTTVTFAADPGDATKTATGAIPAGAYNVAVTGRVIVADTNGGGCTTVDIGGADPNLWVDDLDEATVGATFGSADWTAATPYHYATATDIVLTPDSNCFDLSVLLEVFYCIATGPTRGE